MTCTALDHDDDDDDWTILASDIARRFRISRRTAGRLMTSGELESITMLGGPPRTCERAVRQFIADHAVRS